MSGFLCALPLISSLLSGCLPATATLAGFVEGDYVLVAPLVTARIVEVAVEKGDRVAAGAVVARQESEDAEAAVAQAEAALARARAQLSDLVAGKRPAEIDAIEASLAAAEASAGEAERETERQAQLVARKVASPANLDTARSKAASARAAAREIAAQLELARLPPRPKERAAASAAVREAEAALRYARWRLAQRSILAANPSVVADVLKREGELAGPNEPVVSLLPDGAVHVVAFVPEPLLAAAAIGTRIGVRCDGCAETFSAVVTFVATEPEFTPPVIYSLDARQKLVWRVEARPADGAEVLKPGQIVDVVLPRADS